jgi:hypothetical protein
MCFSATASLSLGVALIPIGIYSIKRAATQQPSFLMLAIIPLLFAFQQISEGFVWLGITFWDVFVTRVATLDLIFSLSYAAWCGSLYVVIPLNPVHSVVWWLYYFVIVS